MPAWTVERASPDDWQRVRAVRLRALADTPDAFGMTLAEDEALPIETWRERLENLGAATFLGVADGGDVALVVSIAYDGQPDAAGLFAMWVAPEARGRGLGEAMVGAVVDWARDAGFDRVILDVADTNAAAIALYAKCGFDPTGHVGTLPAPREHILEHQRGLDLRGEGRS